MGLGFKAGAECMTFDTTGNARGVNIKLGPSRRFWEVPRDPEPTAMF